MQNTPAREANIRSYSKKILWDLKVLCGVQRNTPLDFIPSHISQFAYPDFIPLSSILILPVIYVSKLQVVSSPLFQTKNMYEFISSMRST
jgi:hypothetical protein